MIVGKFFCGNPSNEDVAWPMKLVLEDTSEPINVVKFWTVDCVIS